MYIIKPKATTKITKQKVIVNKEQRWKNRIINSFDPTEGKKRKKEKQEKNKKIDITYKTNRK